MEPIWSEDENGELWLDNPYIAIANPRRRRKGGPRKGVIPPGLKRYMQNKRRSRSAPKRRRRSSSTAVTHYRARRNPGGGRWGGMLAGLDLGTIAGVATGFAAPKFVMAQVQKVMPDSVMASNLGYWVVKTGSALLPGYLVRSMKRDFGRNMMIGGAVSLVLDALQTYAPGFMSGMGQQPFLGYYSAGMLAAGPGVNQIPARLGMYNARGGYPAGAANTRITATVPSRLNPGSRF